MTNPMHRVEFIALIAMMFATIAFSIDSMLPALPEIAQELSPTDVNRAQLILTSFVLGMGVGTLFTGPLSDALGRRKVILGGAVIYILGSALAWASTSLEMVLLGRLIQGLGAAGPRIVSIAVVRDFYSGRIMARIMSIAMMIFMIVPALAPLLGQIIIQFTGWRGIFVAFVGFAMIVILWVWARLPESLAVEKRRPFRAKLLWAATLEMLRHPTVRLSIVVQSFCMGVLFTMLTMVQPVYDVIFDQGENFPLWFGGVAALSGTASMLNAWLVVRVGMRRMVTVALGAQILVTGAVAIALMSDLGIQAEFWVFVLWQVSVFSMAGVTMGNLNAIAMEPMEHIAGMAASVIGFISTCLAVVIAAPVGQLFNGTLWPLLIGILGLTTLGYLCMVQMGRIERRDGLR